MTAANKEELRIANRVLWEFLMPGGKRRTELRPPVYITEYTKWLSDMLEALQNMEDSHE